MTKRITVSLPDDLADRLEAERNASAFVAESLRRTIEAENLWDAFRKAGVRVTREGIERQRQLLHEADERRAAKLQQPRGSQAA